MSQKENIKDVAKLEPGKINVVLHLVSSTDDVILQVPFFCLFFCIPFLAYFLYFMTEYRFSLSP